MHVRYTYILHMFNFNQDCILKMHARNEAPLDMHIMALVIYPVYFSCLIMK